MLYGGLQYDVASTTMQGEAEKSGQYPFPLAEEDVVCGGNLCLPSAIRGGYPKSGAYPWRAPLGGLYLHGGGGN